MIPPEEHRHLISGPRVGERASGAGTVRVVARCLGDAGRVLERGREVLEAVLAHTGPPWPSADNWRWWLPAWFVEACGPEQFHEEADRWLGWWRGLPPEDQARAAQEQRWTLMDWPYWLEPSERQWFWWDGLVEDPEHLQVIVEVAGWPAPLGALEWLLRASGAVEVAHHEPAKA